MYRATEVLPLSSNRQRSVDESRKWAPSSVSRVPPSTGPSSGATALTHIGAWYRKLPPLRRVSPSLRSSRLDHPVADGGETHRTASAPCVDADTSSPTPKRHATATSPRCTPEIVTSVPPCSGPLHGDTSRTTADTYSYCRPDEVKSRPFVLTSTPTTPAADEVVLHTSAVSSTRDAATTVPLMRHWR